MKQITISFDVLGNSNLDAEGFTGTSCEDATKNYLEALNAKKSDDTKKPEYSLPNSGSATIGEQW